VKAQKIITDFILRKVFYAAITWIVIAVFLCPNPPVIASISRNSLAPASIFEEGEGKEGELEKIIAKTGRKITKTPLFTEENLLGKTELWKKFTEINKGKAPAVIHLVSNDKTIESQFEERIKEIPDEQLVYLSIEYSTSEKSKIDPSEKRDVTRHIVIVDSAKVLKKNTGRILSGNINLNAFHFSLYLSEYREQNNIHFYIVSLGKKEVTEDMLQGKGFMRKPFMNIAEILNENFQGYMITAYAVNRNAVRRFFEFSGFNPRWAMVEGNDVAIKLVDSYQGLGRYFNENGVLYGRIPQERKDGPRRPGKKIVVKEGETGPAKSTIPEEISERGLTAEFNLGAISISLTILSFLAGSGIWPSIALGGFSFLALRKLVSTQPISSVFKAMRKAGSLAILFIFALTVTTPNFLSPAQPLISYPIHRPPAKIIKETPPYLWGLWDIGRGIEKYLIGENIIVEGLISKTLEYKDEYVQVAMYMALVKIGPPAAGPLNNILNDKKVSAFAREKIPSILAEIGDESSGKPLVTALGDKDILVRIAAAEALCKLITKGAVKETKEEVDALFIASFDYSDISSCRLREAAVKALVEVAKREAAFKPRIVKRLIKALSQKENGEGDIYVNEAAAIGLGELKVEEAVTTLAELVLNDDEDGDVRFAALTALGKIGGEKVFWFLLKCLDDEYLCIDAMSILADLRDRRAVDYLVPLLLSEDEDIRLAAEETLEILWPKKKTQIAYAPSAGQIKDTGQIAAVHGQMKGLNKRDPMDEDTELDFSDRHEEFKKLVESVEPDPDVYGVKARVIFADLGKVGAYHFYPSKDDPSSLIIVVNSRYPDIYKEAKFHEAKEVELVSKGFTQHEAHVIASALQEQRFSMGGKLTAYHKAQLRGMNKEQLEAIVKEDEADRAWHHDVLARANEAGASINIQGITEYEDVLRLAAGKALAGLVPIDIYGKTYWLDNQILKGIRLAKIEDVSAIYKLSRLIYREDGFFDEEDYREIFEEPSVYIWVYSEKEVKGYSYVRIREKDGNKIVWVEDIAVEEAEQGRGIGKALLAVVLEKMEELNVNRLEADAKTASEKLFESFGFECGKSEDKSQKRSGVDEIGIKNYWFIPQVRKAAREALAGFVPIKIYKDTYQLKKQIFNGIRPATIEDAHAIWELSRLIHGEKSDFPNEEYYETILKRKSNDIWVCYKNGEVKGYIYTEYTGARTKTRDKIMSVAEIAVEKDGEKGIGRALLAGMMERMEELNVGALVAVLNSESEKLFESFGFKRDGGEYQEGLELKLYGFLENHHWFIPPSSGEITKAEGKAKLGVTVKPLSYPGWTEEELEKAAAVLDEIAKGHGQEVSDMYEDKTGSLEVGAFWKNFYSRKGGLYKDIIERLETIKKINMLNTLGLKRAVTAVERFWTIMKMLYEQTRDPRSEVVSVADGKVTISKLMWRERSGRTILDVNIIPLDEKTIREASGGLPTFSIVRKEGEKRIINVYLSNDSNPEVMFIRLFHEIIESILKLELATNGFKEEQVHPIVTGIFEQLLLDEKAILGRISDRNFAEFAAKAADGDKKYFKEIIKGTSTKVDEIEELDLNPIIQKYLFDHTYNAELYAKAALKFINRGWGRDELTGINSRANFLLEAADEADKEGSKDLAKALFIEAICVTDFSKIGEVKYDGGLGAFKIILGNTTYFMDMGRVANVMDVLDILESEIDEFIHDLRLMDAGMVFEAYKNILNEMLITPDNGKEVREFFDKHYKNIDEIDKKIRRETMINEYYGREVISIISGENKDKSARDLAFTELEEKIERLRERLIEQKTTEDITDIDSLSFLMDSEPKQFEAEKQKKELKQRQLAFDVLMKIFRDLPKSFEPSYYLRRRFAAVKIGRYINTYKNDLNEAEGLYLGKMSLLLKQGKGAAESPYHEFLNLFINVIVAANMDDVESESAAAIFADSIYFNRKKGKLTEEQFKDLIEKYFSSVIKSGKTTKGISIEEFTEELKLEQKVKSLADRLRKGNQEAKLSLSKDMESYIKRIAKAKRYADIPGFRAFDIGDAASIRAVNKYDFGHKPGKYKSFYTYVKSVINKALDDAVRNYWARKLDIPKSLAARLPYYNSLKDELGYPPTVDEIAQKLRLSKRDAKRMSAAMKKYIDESAEEIVKADEKIEKIRKANYLIGASN